MNSLLILFGGIIFSIIIRQIVKKTDTVSGNNYEFFTPDIVSNSNQVISFGYKMGWFAIKTSNRKRLLELLKLKNQTDCSWFVGLNDAKKNILYVTPQIGEWILICGEKFLNAVDEKQNKIIKDILIKFSDEFGEVNFFATNRIIEYHCWIKAVDNIIVREYSYLGEKGTNLFVNGTETNIEKNYNLINTFTHDFRASYQNDLSDKNIPNEEIVMQIAENWSIDPTKIEDRDDISNEYGTKGEI